MVVPIVLGAAIIGALAAAVIMTRAYKAEGGCSCGKGLQCDAHHEHRHSETK